MANIDIEPYHVSTDVHDRPGPALGESTGCTPLVAALSRGHNTYQTLCVRCALERNFTPPEAVAVAVATETAG